MGSEMCIRDSFGPGPAIAANDAESWRASVGVPSCNGAAPLAANCSRIALVA